MMGEHFVLQVGGLFLSVGMIAGLVITHTPEGMAAGMAVAAATFFLLYRRRRNKTDLHRRPERPPGSED